MSYFLGHVFQPSQLRSFPTLPTGRYGRPMPCEVFGPLSLVRWVPQVLLDPCIYFMSNSNTLSWDHSNHSILITQQRIQQINGPWLAGLHYRHWGFGIYFHVALWGKLGPPIMGHQKKKNPDVSNGSAYGKHQH